MSDQNTAIDLTANPYLEDFALLDNSPDLHYLDSAATSQRPASVLDAQRRFQEELNSNPMRGVYELSALATAAVEEARQKVADFINAPDAREVIFTRNTTESLNLIALGYAPKVLSEGDEVVISIMEHHSNLVPWQQACRLTGAKLVYLYPNAQGIITLDEIEAKIGPQTRIVSIGHVSNVLGVRNPIEAITAQAHKFGATVIVDGAQSAPHLHINVQELGIDAFAFSGHKMMAPMGIGVLWARRPILEAMDPLFTGGEMIERVTEQDATWAQIPHKFEAGTLNAEGIYALGAAIDYLNDHSEEDRIAREHALVKDAIQRLAALPYIEIYGSESPADHHGVIAFNVEGIHPHDVAAILDSHGVAIRAGHHCAEPLCNFLDVQSCCRASLSFYNDADDIDALIDGLEHVWSLFHGNR